MKSLQLKDLNLSSDLILDQAMLQMPINRTKQLKDLIKLKMQQQKIIQQVNTKTMAIKQARQFKNPKTSLSLQQKNRLTKPHPTTQNITALQQQFRTNNTNSSYVGSCVLRALKYRKLAIDDVADIFGIDSEVVEEIDKFRRLKEIEGDDDSEKGMSGQRLDLKKEILMKELEMKFKNAAYEKVVENSFTTTNHMSRPNYQPYSTYKPNSTYLAANTISPSQLTSILSQQQQQQKNVFQYQRLLRNRPPHKLDDKAKAIIQIVIKNPNIMQKEVIKIMADEYKIWGMTQTSVSRYFKKIYQMKRHVEVLLQAKKDGFIDI